MPTALPESASLPRLPLLRIALAVALVPFAYVTLLIAAGLALSMGFGALYGVYVLLFGAHRYTMGIRLIVVAGGVALAALVAAAAVARGVLASLFPRPTEQAGVRLSRLEEPDVYRVVQGVCDRVGCSAPNVVALVLEPNCFATEARVALLDGPVRGRVMGIGCALLNVLTVEELSALIAHELAHFTGRDTLYSRFVVPAFIALGTALEALEDEHADGAEEREGCAAWLMHLPILLPIGLLRVYLALFALLDASVSRQRERRADAIAALAVGREPMGSALRRLREGARTFASEAEAVRTQALATQRLPEPRRVFEAMRARLAEQGADARATDGAPEEPRGRRDAFASHPALADRLAGLPEAPRSQPDERLSRGLVAHLDAYEATLGHALLGERVVVRP
jgi:Zn-dependent protease with chaperone function